MPRRRRRGPPRCRDCNGPVVFFRSAVTRQWRPFDLRPVRDGQQVAQTPWSIENNVWAWPFRDLVEDLMVRLQCGQNDAEEHALAMPRHLPHDCPNRRQEATP